MILTIVTLITRLRLCLSDFSTAWLLFFPTCILWKCMTRSISHSRGSLLSSTPRESNIYIQYLEFFCKKKKLSLSPHLFIKIIYLYQYVLIYIYFILWVIKQCYCYLFYCSNSLATRISFRLALVSI